MKNTIAAISVICIFLLSSCQSKTVSLKSDSSNQKVHIVVTANRIASMEPWKVDISVAAYDFKPGKLLFELESGDINDKTVKFDWKDDRNCIISFDQPDGTPRKFQLIADASQVQLAEVNL